MMLGSKDSAWEEIQRFFDRYKGRTTNHLNTLANTLYEQHQKKTEEKASTGSSNAIAHLVKL